MGDEPSLFTVFETTMMSCIYGGVGVYLVVMLVILALSCRRQGNRFLNLRTCSVLVFLLFMMVRLAWVIVRHYMDDTIIDFSLNRIAFLLSYDGTSLYIHFWIHIHMDMTVDRSSVTRARRIVHSIIGVIDLGANVFLIAIIIVFGVSDKTERVGDPLYDISIVVIALISFIVVVMFIVFGSMLVYRMSKWVRGIDDQKTFKRLRTSFIINTIVTAVASFLRAFLFAYNPLSGKDLADWTYPWFYYLVPDVVVPIILAFDINFGRKRTKAVDGEIDDNFSNYLVADTDTVHDLLQAV